MINTKETHTCQNAKTFLNFGKIDILVSHFRDPSLCKRPMEYIIEILVLAKLQSYMAFRHV